MRPLCIIGAGQSKIYAPFHKDVEIWILNSRLHETVRRFDRQFDIHIPHIYNSLRVDYNTFLSDCGDKLYILDKCPEYPQAKVINSKKMIEKYGNYFTSSFAWILAQAIDEGYEDISLYGIDLKGKEEYENQRACIEYFIGLARGKGIKVWVHPNSKLLKGELYGLV